MIEVNPSKRPTTIEVYKVLKVTVKQTIPIQEENLPSLFESYSEKDITSVVCRVEDRMTIETRDVGITPLGSLKGNFNKESFSSSHYSDPRTSMTSKSELERRPSIEFNNSQMTQSHSPRKEVSHNPSRDDIKLYHESKHYGNHPSVLESLFQAELEDGPHPNFLKTNVPKISIPESDDLLHRVSMELYLNNLGEEIQRDSRSLIFSEPDESPLTFQLRDTDDGTIRTSHSANHLSDIILAERPHTVTEGTIRTSHSANHLSDIVLAERPHSVTECRTSFPKITISENPLDDGVSTLKKDMQHNIPSYEIITNSAKYLGNHVETPLLPLRPSNGSIANNNTHVGDVNNNTHVGNPSSMDTAVSPIISDESMPFNSKYLDNPSNAETVFQHLDSHLTVATFSGDAQNIQTVLPRVNSHLTVATFSGDAQNIQTVLPRVDSHVTVATCLPAQSDDKTIRKSEEKTSTESELRPSKDENRSSVTELQSNIDEKKSSQVQLVEDEKGVIQKSFDDVEPENGETTIPAPRSSLDESERCALSVSQYDERSSYECIAR